MNGNTQFGTATPNGNVNTDAWLDSTASDTLFSAGALKGFAVAPTSTTGLSLNVGGTAGVNDVAIAKNVAGDTARIAGHASTPYVLTLPGAPGTSGQSKVFSIVAYIDTTITAMVQNGVDTVGVTYVAGTAATTGSQVPPTDAQIRSAIPNGQTAFISVVANVTLAYGATAIVAGNIAANKSTMPSENVAGATMIGYAHQSNAQSDIQSGGIVNGSALFFKNLDPNKKYLVKYTSSFGVYYINVGASSTSIIRWSNDGNSWNNFGESILNTIRAASSGADDVCRTHNADICFSGKSQIYLRVNCLDSNGILRYAGGNTTAELYQVPNGFIANI